MKTKLKSILAASLLFSCTSAFALDAKSALTEDAKTIVNNASTLLKLNLKPEDQLRLYDSLFKAYVQDGWNMKPVNSNSFLSASKTQDNPVQFAQYSLSYKERTVMLSLINYPKEKQIISTTTEILPTSTTKVLEFYNDKKKKDSGWENVYDTSNYSMFQKENSISYTNYHVSGEHSSVMYSSGSVFNY